MSTASTAESRDTIIERLHAKIVDPSNAGASPCALIAEIGEYVGRCREDDAECDRIDAEMQAYIDTLDEHSLTILTLYQRTRSPIEVARMMNADVDDTRRALAAMMVAMRMRVFNP